MKRLGVLVALLVTVGAALWIVLRHPSPPLGQAVGVSKSVTPLKLLVFSPAERCGCSADLDPALDDAMAAAQRTLGFPIEIRRIAERGYVAAAREALAGAEAPDLLWVRIPQVVELARNGAIAPLDELVAQYPFLTEGLSRQAQLPFVIDDRLRAVPLAERGEEARIGTAISSAALRRERVRDAAELIAFLRPRVPLPGGIDLAVGSFDLRAEKQEEGAPATLHAVITNHGAESVEAVPVRFTLDRDTILDEQFVRRLDPGAAIGLDLTVRLPAVGPHDYAVMVDPARLVTDKNYWNNKGGGYSNTTASGTGVVAPSVTKGPFLIAANQSYLRRWEDLSLDTFVRTASNGTNYLVVWHKDTAAGAHKLMAARVSAAGAVLDTAGIVVAQGSGHLESFDVDFDGTNYLVVWAWRLGTMPSSQGPTLANPYSVIRAARVSSAGVVLDTTPIAIATAACSSCLGYYSTVGRSDPSVAATGSGALVTWLTSTTGWVQAPESIDAVLVSSAGKIVAGPKSLASFSGTQIAPVYWQSLAYHPAKGEGFLAFDAGDYSGGSTSASWKHLMLGLWVKVSGTTITASAVKTVDTETDYDKRFERPSVAAGASGSYLAAWEGEGSKAAGTWQDSLGSLVSSSTLGTFSARKILASSSALDPDLAWDGKGYELVYTVPSGSPSGCYSNTGYLGAARIGSGGGIGNSTTFTSLNSSFTGNVEEASVAYSSTNGLAAFRVVDSGSASPVFSIYGVLLDMTP
jgi:hypothetical protein